MRVYLNFITWANQKKSSPNIRVHHLPYFSSKGIKKTKDIDILSILALLEMAISFDFTPMILKNLKFNMYLVGSKKLFQIQH